MEDEVEGSLGGRGEPHGPEEGYFGRGDPTGAKRGPNDEGVGTKVCVGPRFL